MDLTTRIVQYADVVLVAALAMVWVRSPRVRRAGRRTATATPS